MALALACAAAASPGGQAGAETQAEGSPQDAVVCKVELYSETPECLQRLKGLVVRTGDTLRLKLSNGKTKTYIGDHKACAEGRVAKCAVYLVLRYYPQLGSFLISASSYECGHNELVNRRTGSTLKISSSSTTPTISPHGKYIVSTDMSDACSREYDIAIWSTETDPPSLEMMYESAQYENWEVIGWTSDDRFRLKAFVNSDKGSYDQEAEAVRSAGGWELVLGEKSNVVEREPRSKNAVPSWPKSELSPWPKDPPAPAATRPP